MMRIKFFRAGTEPLLIQKYHVLDCWVNFRIASDARL